MKATFFMELKNARLGLFNYGWAIKSQERVRKYIRDLRNARQRA
jgi:hypothetical protein